MSSDPDVGPYTRGLARALDARGDVELVQLLSGDAEPVVPGAAVLRAARNPFDPRAGAEFARLADEASPHVIHCPHVAVPSPVRFPLVVNVHDLAPLSVEGVMDSPVRRFAYRRRLTRAVSVAGVVLTPSRFIADEVSRHAPAARGKLAVGGVGADDFADGERAPLPDAVEQFLLGPSALASQGSTAPYLLAMGSTRPQDDVPTVLRAFAILAARRTDVVLLLVGAPPSSVWLASEAARALAWGRTAVGERRVASMIELAERITFTGPVTDAELRGLYAGARAFVIPSRYEGSGRHALEAMALGAPVISSDAGALPEVVGEAGLLAPADSPEAFALAMGRVLSDDVFRASLAERGEARAQTLRWASAVRHAVGVYRGLIENASAGGGSSAGGAGRSPV